MTSPTVVQVKNMVKKYGDFAAIKGLSFEINKGECFGVLGPKGAGKSSLMRIMYGASSLSSGDVFILGLNVNHHMTEIKSRIGVVPQNNGLDFDLSVVENLKLYGRFFGIEEKVLQERSENLLRMVKMEDRSESSILELSDSLQKRLAMARSLMNGPEVLFLDEPTVMLDPESRSWSWKFLKSLKSPQTTLVLSTHFMEEAEHLCDRIALVDRGQLLALGDPKKLVDEFVGHEVVEFDATSQDLNYYTQKLKDQKFEYLVYHNTVHVFIDDQRTSKDVIQMVMSDRILARRATLNDVFLKLSGTQLRET